MQLNSVDTPEEVNMMKLLSKIQTFEAQKSLLIQTVEKKELLDSKIISSLQPKVGKIFTNLNIESRKRVILQNTRKRLLTLAIEEKEQELKDLNVQFEQFKNEYTINNEKSKPRITNQR